MKKARTKTAEREDDGMRAEYDLAGGTRGKHYSPPVVEMRSFSRVW